jgi:hypothetical protein
MSKIDYKYANELKPGDKVLYSINLGKFGQRTGYGRVVENNERFVLVRTRNYLDTILKASLIDGESTVGVAQ